MPGVPFETRGMLDEVRRHVTEHFGSAGLIMHREFTVTGISESDLAERLAPFEDALPDGFKRLPAFAGRDNTASRRFALCTEGCV